MLMVTSIVNPTVTHHPSLRLIAVLIIKTQRHTAKAFKYMDPKDLHNSSEEYLCSQFSGQRQVD